MPDTEWLSQIDALIVRIQHKEHLALEILYEEAASHLYAVVFKILKTPAESEDVLQEVFIKVWQQASQYRGSGTAWGWLCVMARHSALDRLRQVQRQPQSQLDDEYEDIWQQVEEGQHQHDRHWLGQCLKKLEEPARQAILLSYVEGYSHGEISTHLSRPLGTVKAWIRRGLGELKQCLAP